MRILVSAVFLSIVFQVSGQSHVVDSLSSILKGHAHEDTTQVNILNELSLRIFKIQPEKSFAYAEKALRISNQLSFQKGAGRAMNNLAVYHLMKGNAEVSLELVFESAKIGEHEHLADLTADSYAIAGTVYHSQLDFAKALRYLRMAQQLNERVSNPLIASKILNALGGIARDHKQYDSALFYYDKALAVMKQSHEGYRMAEVITNIGHIYSRLNKSALALEYYFKALNEAKENDNQRGEALAAIGIGHIFLGGKKYQDAEKFLLQSLAISRQIGDRKMLSGIYMGLMQLKNETGKFEEAHQYMSSYYQMKDSLLNAERAGQIAELEIRYETQEKEHAIQLLERDRKIQSLWKNILTASLILLVIASMVVYYLQRYKERKNRQILNLEIEQLTTQHSELSEKYKNVLTGGVEKSVDSHDQRLLKRAIEVVESNMSNPLFSVEKMAKEVGMSRTNMHRKIKAITGFPPSELIRSIRLRKAAILLLSKADSVSQISFTVGFDDHSYFSKSFKKQFGVTPSEYLQSRGQRISDQPRA